MSVQRAREEVETAVRNASQWSTTLHRQDPDADEPRPACREAARESAEFTTAELENHPGSIYRLCLYPECFGGERA